MSLYIFLIIRTSPSLRRSLCPISPCKGFGTPSGIGFYSVGIALNKVTYKVSNIKNIEWFLINFIHTLLVIVDSPFIDPALSE
jgi:hypothetical protein